MKTRILVVDDEPDLMATLSDYLRQAGYQPLGAHDAHTALDDPPPVNGPLLKLV